MVHGYEFYSTQSSAVVLHQNTNLNLKNPNLTLPPTTLLAVFSSKLSDQHLNEHSGHGSNHMYKRTTNLEVGQLFRSAVASGGTALTIKIC